MDAYQTNDAFLEEKKCRRFSTVSDARSIFDTWKQDNAQRASSFVAVRNQLEGGRPKDPAALKRNGTEWETNINFGDSQAMRDRVLLPLWKAVHGAPHAVSVTVDSNSPDSGRWQTAFEEGFDYALDMLGQEYIIQFMRACKNLIDFGGGPIYWEDKNAIGFRAINLQRMYFPRNTRMNMSSWEAIGIVDDISASELWQHVKSNDATEKSESVGWNTKAIKEAIVYSSGNHDWDGLDFTRYADQLVNNDAAVSSKWAPLDLAIIYIKQFDGKIAKYIFPERSGSTKDFIYKNEKYADSWEEIFGVVWYDTGVDAMVHSVKGFGVKNYHHSMLINRMRCKIVDSASFALSLNFKKSDGMPDETPPVECYGTVNIFPKELEQIPNYPQFSQGFQILQMLEQNQSQNNSLYNQQNRQVAESNTATQAKILAMQEGEVTEASMALFLAQVGESYFGRMMRRLRMRDNPDPIAVAFIQCLVDKGVPLDVIFTVKLRVKCGTSAGMANPIFRGQTIMEMAQYAAGRPGFNTRWLDEQVVSNKLGSQAVSKALLPAGVDSEPEQRRQAMIENLAFGQGAPLPIGPSDAHAEHIDEHLKPTEAAINQFKQNGQYDQARLSADVLATEHSGEHLTMLANDETRKPQFIVLKARLTGVQSILRGIISRVQQMQSGSQTNIN